MRVEKALNLLWIVLGLAIASLSSRYTLIDTAGPGGGFLPLATGLIIAVCGLFLMFSSVDAESENWPAVSVWLRMAAIVAGLAAIAIVMPYLGFILTVVPVMILLMQAVERQSWMTVLLVSIVSTFAVYFLFTRLLGTALPRGLLGF
ncbi:MAG: tripartite tricarboxylate transporter TctB family protein [Hyphomicrobiaceae bacterium]